MVINDNRLLFHSINAIRIYINDPIDNGKTLRDSSRDMFFNWCEEHCIGKYWVGMGFCEFELEDDVTLFKLTWK